MSNFGSDAEESRGGADAILQDALQAWVVSELGIWDYRNIDEDGGYRRSSAATG